MRKNIPPQLLKKSGGIFFRESLSPIDESAAPPVFVSGADG